MPAREFAIGFIEICCISTTPVVGSVSTDNSRFIEHKKYTIYSLEMFVVEKIYEWGMCNLHLINLFQQVSTANVFGL